MRCKICFQQFDAITIWQQFLPLTKEKRVVCQRCLDDFEIIVPSARRCGRCKVLFTNEDGRHICHDCIMWEEEYDVIIDHQVLFAYNAFAKSLIWQMKHNRNFHLLPVLGVILRKHMMCRYDLSKTLFVPMPTDEETLHYRGVWIVENILRSSGLPYVPMLEKNVYNGKQHKKEKHARHRMAEQHLSLIYDKIPNKKIIIFDDIYTTGATIVSGYRALKSISDTQFESASFFR